MAVPASGTEQTADASLTFPMDKKIDARPMRDLEIDALAALRPGRCLMGPRGAKR